MDRAFILFHIELADPLVETGNQGFIGLMQLVLVPGKDTGCPSSKTSSRPGWLGSASYRELSGSSPPPSPPTGPPFEPNLHPGPDAMPPTPGRGRAFRAIGVGPRTILRNLGSRLCTQRGACRLRIDGRASS